MSNLDSQVFSMQVVRIDIDFNAVHGIEDKYGIEIQDAGTLNVEVQLPQSDNDLVRVMTQTKEFIVETMDGNDKLTNRFILKGVVNLSLRFDFDYSTGEPVILYGTYMFKKLLQKELNRPNPFKKSGAI